MSSIYLLLGPEEGDKNEAISAIRKELHDSHPELEEESYYAGEDDKDAIESLYQPSLFSSFRIITVKHMENAKKDGALIKGLKGYLKEADPDIALILISQDTISPFTAAEEKHVEKKVFYEIFDSDKIAWIRTEFRKYGFSVTEDAIEEIMSSVENNKAEMKNLIELISSYYRGKDKDKKVIDGDDVASVITREKGENGYTLFKAVANRNLEKAIMIISSIALNDPMRLIGTLMTLTGEFRVAENIIALRDSGMSEKDVQKEAHGLSTTPFSSKGFNFRRKDGLYAAIKNYTPSEISRIVAYLSIQDNELKKAGSDALETFEDIIYTVIVNSGKENRMRLYEALIPSLV